MINNINVIFLFLALIAEIIGTVGGFGSSVFFVPIAGFYFAFQSVLGLTAVFHVASNLSKIFLFKAGLNKYLIIYIGAPAVLFVIIGGLLSKYFDSKYLEIFLGIFLISLSLLFLIKERLTIKTDKPQSMAGGALSGFIAGLLGTGGAIRGLTMTAFNLEKNVFIATSAFIDFMVDASRTVVYYYNGYIKTELLIYLPFLIVIGFIGTYIGKKMLNYISEIQFRKVSLWLILLIGIITIINQIVNTSLILD